MLFPDGSGSVETGAEALFGPGVVDERRLDALGWSDCGYRCNDTSSHAGEQIAHGRKGACFWVGEGGFDLIEEEESDTIFSDGTLCLCWS